MAAHPLRMLGDPVLRTPARQVDDIDDRISRLIEDMFATMDAAGGIGLAAPQIGVGLRMFTYDAAGARGAIINPELRLIGEPAPTPRDMEDGPAEGDNLLREGCLSVTGIYSPVSRPQRALLTGTSPEGTAVHMEASGLLAACFQHEVDHLEGRLFLDRLTGDDRRRAMQALRATAKAPEDPRGRGGSGGRGAQSPSPTSASSFFRSPALKEGR